MGGNVNSSLRRPHCVDLNNDVSSTDVRKATPALNGIFNLHVQFVSILAIIFVPYRPLTGCNLTLVSGSSHMLCGRSLYSIGVPFRSANNLPLATTLRDIFLELLQILLRRKRLESDLLEIRKRTQLKEEPIDIVCPKERFESGPTDFRFRLRAQVSRPPHELFWGREVEVVRGVWQELSFLTQLLTDPFQVHKVNEPFRWVFHVPQAVFGGVDIAIGRANVVSAKGVLIDGVANLARNTQEI
jgi:hypothetical protein